MNAPHPIAPRPVAPRPARGRNGTSLLAQGENMLWLTSGALAVCSVMIVGFLALVLAQGTATFWSRPLVEVALDDVAIDLAYLFDRSFDRAKDPACDQGKRDEKGQEDAERETPGPQRRRPGVGETGSRGARLRFHHLPDVGDHARRLPGELRTKLVELGFDRGVLSRLRILDDLQDA